MAKTEYNLSLGRSTGTEEVSKLWTMVEKLEVELDNMTPNAKLLMGKLAALWDRRRQPQTKAERRGKCKMISNAKPVEAQII